MSSVVRLARPSVALGPAVEAFLADRDLAETTRRVYELTLAALVEDLHAGVDVAAITTDELRSFLRRRHGRAAAKTWNRVVATLGSFFAYCRRQGWVAMSAAAGLERHRERANRAQVQRTRAIPLEELEAFLAVPGHGLRERLLWRMLYETAARAQEVLLLDVEDLDVANKRALVIGKGGQRRAHRLGDAHRQTAPPLPRRPSRWAAVPVGHRPRARSATGDRRRRAQHWPGPAVVPAAGGAVQRGHRRLDPPPAPPQPPDPPRRGRRHRPVADGQEPPRQRQDPEHLRQAHLRRRS
jgi:integrase